MGASDRCDFDQIVSQFTWLKLERMLLEKMIKMQNVSGQTTNEIKQELT